MVVFITVVTLMLLLPIARHLQRNLKTNLIVNTMLLSIIWHLTPVNSLIRLYVGSNTRLVIDQILMDMGIMNPHPLFSDFVLTFFIAIVFWAITYYIVTAFSLLTDGLTIVDGKLRRTKPVKKVTKRLNSKKRKRSGK